MEETVQLKKKKRTKEKNCLHINSLNPDTIQTPNPNHHCWNSSLYEVHKLLNLRLNSNVQIIP